MGHGGAGCECSASIPKIPVVAVRSDRAFRIGARRSEVVRCACMGKSKAGFRRVVGYCFRNRCSWNNIGYLIPGRVCELQVRNAQRDWVRRFSEKFEGHAGEEVAFD